MAIPYQSKPDVTHLHIILFLWVDLVNDSLQIIHAYHFPGIKRSSFLARKRYNMIGKWIFGFGMVRKMGKLPFLCAILCVLATFDYFLLNLDHRLLLYQFSIISVSWNSTYAPVKAFPARFLPA